MFLLRFNLFWRLFLLLLFFLFLFFILLIILLRLSLRLRLILLQRFQTISITKLSLKRFVFFSWWRIWICIVVIFEIIFNIFFTFFSFIVLALLIRLLCKGGSFVDLWWHPVYCINFKLSVRKNSIWI